MAEKILPATLFVSVLLVLSVDQASSDESDHRYRQGDQVPFYVNNVGPYYNPRLESLPPMTLVSSPLLVLGGIIGKNSKAEFQAPCRTAENPREIPPLRWYRQTIPQMAIAGFLPFILIHAELYYIFATVWGHRIYTIYGILFIIFITLLIVTALITVALTHLQLAAEDHRWWWRSFLCGGSTGLFIYAYCFYYYYARTDMSGFMQTSFLFGYMACVSFGCFLMLGTVGYLAALRFVRHVYGSIKCE